MVEPVHPPNEPTLAGRIDVHRDGPAIRVYIDGQPFPHLIDPDVAVFLGDVGGAVRITIPTTLVQVVDTPPQPEPPKERVDVPAGVAQLVAGIAATRRAVTYHPADPNAAAIEQCARDHGIPAVPNPALPPRTIRAVDQATEGRS